jgi:hypothetical protein
MHGSSNPIAVVSDVDITGQLAERSGGAFLVAASI